MPKLSTILKTYKKIHNIYTHTNISIYLTRNPTNQVYAKLVNHPTIVYCLPLCSFHSLDLLHPCKHISVYSSTNTSIHHIYYIIVCVICVCVQCQCCSVALEGGRSVAAGRTRCHSFLPHNTPPQCLISVIVCHCGVARTRLYKCTSVQRTFSPLIPSPYLFCILLYTYDTNTYKYICLCVSINAPGANAYSHQSNLCSYIWTRVLLNYFYRNPRAKIYSWSYITITGLSFTLSIFLYFVWWWIKVT